MNDPLDGNEKLDVNISHLYATDEQLEKLENLIVEGLGSNGTPPNITFVGMDEKGARYEVKFKVFNIKNFKLDIVKNWLHSATLVGWNMRGTLVH